MLPEKGPYAAKYALFYTEQLQNQLDDQATPRQTRVLGHHARHGFFNFLGNAINK